MAFLCITSPDWAASSMDRFGMAVLKVDPRVTVDAARKQIWVDGKSLEIPGLCRSIRTHLEQQGSTKPTIGIALTPIAAEIAARSHGMEADSVVTVPLTGEREFI